MQNIIKKNDKNYREGVWKLISYGVKENDLGWNVITPKNDEKLLLILKNMGLTILNGNEQVENFSFIRHDIKRISYDKDSMGIVSVQEGTEKRWLRFRFSGTLFSSGDDVCHQCAQTLSHYVVAHPINKEDHIGQPNNISLAQYVSQFLKNSKELPNKRIEELESMYPIEDMIEDCILDVNFPDMVLKVQNIIESKLNIK